MADTAPNGPQGAGAVERKTQNEKKWRRKWYMEVWSRATETRVRCLGELRGGEESHKIREQFMMTNKLDTAMWFSRLFTVYCSALFVLPLLGLHEAASFYQRALLANALTSALRLHQRLPHFQLSRAFLAQALLEDSCHYLLYSLIFVNSYPVTMSIFPVLLFSLLHAATYTKKVLDAKGSNSLPLLRSVLDKLSANQQNILKFIACNEIFLMPATVFMLFSGQGSLLQPFIYYRFLTLRYSSRRNPYCRTLFNELRIIVEHIIMKPACPLFVRRLCLQSIAFISRLAPTVA
uniref:Transmembrane protein 33 n=1 Tax=Equus asinus TaxID=9793 RepID=A0A9L0I4N8_EQUAS